MEYIAPHSLGLIGGLVKFTICARVYHVEDKMLILLIGEIKSSIPQLRTLPIKRSAGIRVAAISKFLTHLFQQTGRFLFVLACLR